MNRRIRWIAPTLLCAVLALCFGPLRAEADGGVTYIRRGWNGTSVTQTEVTEQIAQVPADGSMTAGIYFLGSDVTVDDRIF